MWQRQRDSAVLETNKVLKGTYMLLGDAGFQRLLRAFLWPLIFPPLWVGVPLIGFALLFVVNRMADSAKVYRHLCLYWCDGRRSNPLLNAYLAMWWSPAGCFGRSLERHLSSLIVGLYLQSKRDFSFMTGLWSRPYRRNAMIANIFWYPSTVAYWL